MSRTEVIITAVAVVIFASGWASGWALKTVRRRPPPPAGPEPEQQLGEDPPPAPPPAASKDRDPPRHSMEDTPTTDIKKILNRRRLDRGPDSDG